MPKPNTKRDRPVDPKIRDYISWKLSSGDPIATRTARQYALDVDRLGRHLQEDDPPYERLYTAKTPEIREFIAHLTATNARASLKRKLAAIDGFYKYLVSINERKDNPAKGIDLGKTPRRSKELIVLNRDEVRRLLRAPLDPEARKAIGMRNDFSARDRAILHFFYSGPKRHEITGLKTTDFNPQTRTIRVRGRQVPLSKDARDAICEYLAVKPASKNNALFLTREKQPISMRQAWFVLKRYLKACGLREDVDVETLRRSFAIHALEDGVYVLEVLDALGNTSPAALHEYAKIARSGFARRQQATAEAPTEIPFSRFLQCIHDIRMAATNVVVGSGNPQDAEETIRVQVARLKNEWPSLIEDSLFKTLQDHAASRHRDNFKAILENDLSAIERRALDIFSENQRKRQEAGFFDLLHSRVMQASLRHFLAKDYRVALFEAMLALTECIRERTGLDQDGVQLAARVFKPESPLLAVNDLQSQSDRDEQFGMHKLFMGAYEVIRNPNGHDSSRTISETEAAQCLVVISFLMKRAETARTMINA